MPRTTLCACIAPIAAMLVSCASPPPKNETNAALAKFAEEYAEALFRNSPSHATSLGKHAYDTMIEDLSRAAIEKRVAELKSQREKLASVQRQPMSPAERADADYLGASIEAELFDLEALQTWKRNPMGYIYLPGGSIDLLVKRSFAPPKDRLKLVVARLRQAPALLDALKANVENPAREFTDLAIRMCGGSIGFYKETLASWAKEAAGDDQALLQEFTDANGVMIQAVEKTAQWLKADLLPRSKGAYAISADHFSRKLALEEMVDLPLDRLLAIGEANLEKDLRDFVATARKISPSLPPAEVIRRISDEHPSEASLVSDTKGTLEAIRQFLIDKQIVDIPSEVRPTIAETPPYARSGSFASMDTPGPWETDAAEAFYYVTPPEKEWDAKHKEEHLRLYNPPVLKVITVHEAYPGHYLQFLYAKRFPSLTRKILMASSNSEGWAHYTEQMMVEEGFGDGDPKIRLAQLHEALLRDCRYVAGIRLHTAGWTVEQAAKLFRDKGFQEPANAYEEARRGSYNPTYLYYTLGKLQIYKLREDYRTAKGAAYSLKQFHTDFLLQGPLPVRLVRRLLLPGPESPVL